MEDLCQRFPHLAEGIFNSVDSQSFLNCLIASKSLINCVEQEKFFQIRKITETYEDCGDVPFICAMHAGNVMSYLGSYKCILMSMIKNLMSILKKILP